MFLFLFFGNIYAMDSISVSSNSANIIKYGYFTTDKNLTIDDALYYANNNLLDQLPKEAVSFGFDSKTYWYRFDINGTQDAYLNVKNPVASYCELFIFDNNKLISHQINGYGISIKDRPVKAYSLAFKIPNNQQNLVLLLKVNSVNPMFSAFSFEDKEDIYASDFKNVAIQIVAISICAAMILYYIFIFFVTKEMLNIYYCLYIATFYFLNFILSGMLAFFPLTWLIENIPLFVALSIILFDISITLFSIYFLDLNRYSKKLKKFVIYSLIISIVSVLLIPIGHGLQKFAVIGIYFNCFALLFAGLYSFVKFNNRSALIYSFATGVSILICMAYMLMTQGYLVSYDFWTFNLLSIGVIWDVVFLSLALAHRIKQLIEQNSKLEQEKSTNEKLVAIGETINSIAYQWRQLIEELNYILMFLKSKLHSQNVTQEDIKEVVRDQDVVLNKMLNIISRFQNDLHDSGNDRFYLKEVANEAMHQLELLMHESNIEITNDIADNLIIACDKNRFFEALLILMDGSIGIAQKSGVAKPVIALDAKIKNGKMEIYVSNNGSLVKSVDKLLTEQANESSANLQAAKNIITNELGGVIYAQNYKKGIKFNIVIS